MLDIGLPGLDGLEAAKRIHEAVPSTKILFVSMNSNAVVVRAAMSNGGSGYVLKTDSASELLTAIDTVLQGKRFVSSGVSSFESTDCD